MSWAMFTLLESVTMLLSKDLGQDCSRCSVSHVGSMYALVLAGDAGTHGGGDGLVQAETEPVPGHIHIS